MGYVQGIMTLHLNICLYICNPYIHISRIQDCIGFACFASIVKFIEGLATLN
jgi:hypothetical protein